MTRLVRIFTVLAAAAACLPTLAVADETEKTGRSPSVDEQIARFSALARLTSLRPSGAFELRVWSELGSNVFGEIYADGRWRFLAPGDYQDGDTNAVERREETIVTVPAPDAAVVQATRALLAFDGGDAGCDAVLDGAYVLIQASVDGRPLQLTAANPGSCDDEMSRRVLALLKAVRAVYEPYRIKPD